MSTSALGGFDGIGVTRHGVFVLLGVIVATVLYLRAARRARRLDDDHLAVLAGALIGGVLFAKLGVIWRYLGDGAGHSLADLALRGGQSVLGGLAGAYLGALAIKRVIGMRRSTGELFAAPVALGISIGRVGCLLTEIPGRPADLPWSVTVDAARAATIPGFPVAWIGRPLHPSFAYEIAFHLAAFVLLLRLGRDPVWAPDLFKVYLALYAPVRFLLEWTRANPTLALGLSGSQWFLIPSMILLGGWLWRRGKRPEIPKWIAVEALGERKS
ncbi:MAG TPA: prolipoprotein diacylglyceryl transferase family protein [Thermoanaerobaculia bacterium]|nr:prolipoprotein diacylglyceryl transferase family protein [Thermoanaerobaculia bacterium]